MLVCRNVDWFGFLDCCWTYYLEGEVMDVQKIKELALANGFSLKEQASGNMDLHSYVYEFANAIEQAAKAQAVPKWISVKDNLPPANILVLGMSQTRSNIFNIYNVMALDEFEEADVTHWMPLPDAPQEPAND